MAPKKKKTPAEDLMDSLLDEVSSDRENDPRTKIESHPEGLMTVIDHPMSEQSNILQATVIDGTHDSQRGYGGSEKEDFSDRTNNAYESTEIYVPENLRPNDTADSLSSVFDLKNPPAPPVSLFGDLAPSEPIDHHPEPKNAEPQFTLEPEIEISADVEPVAPKNSLFDLKTEIHPSASAPLGSLPPPQFTSAPTFSDATQAVNDGTLAIDPKNARTQVRPSYASNTAGDSDKTLAVTGFQIKPEQNFEDKVKVSVGQQSSRSATGFASWGGGVEGNLSQAGNLRMAQEKILELENENERLRRQNEELMAAAEIIKERSDLLTAQLTEFKNDRDGLEQSFKNEMTVIKNHLARKDAELQKAQFKVDELESRLKFDMKKIRVRERELENRLELVRAEKNAISKNKDDQILDLRRKMDVIQMEVDSYRQKCVDLNKQIESSQDSFKRTTRALRLAMANLELQEENKIPLKKAE